jgi:hypothetical protein
MMGRRAPDFYLTSAGEAEAVARPRACYSGPFISDGRRNDLLMVDIDPPIDKMVFGKPLARIVLASRLEGWTLRKPRNWPIPVYVARLRDTVPSDTRAVAPEDVQLIAWGQLFQTEAEAQTLYRQHHGRDRITILMEQDGAPEEQLKKWLAWKFESNPAVERAYLVRAQRQTTTLSEMVLLIVVQNDKKDLRAVEEAAAVFRELFPNSEHLDITIYDENDAARIPKWVNPFYASRAAPAT